MLNFHFVEKREKSLSLFNRPKIFWQNLSSSSRPGDSSFVKLAKKKAQKQISEDQIQIKKVRPPKKKKDDISPDDILQENIKPKKTRKPKKKKDEIPKNEIPKDEAPKDEVPKDEVPKDEVQPKKMSESKKEKALFRRPSWRNDLDKDDLFSEEDWLRQEKLDQEELLQEELLEKALSQKVFIKEELPEKELSEEELLHQEKLSADAAEGTPEEKDLLGQSNIKIAHLQEKINEFYKPLKHNEEYGEAIDQRKSLNRREREIHGILEFERSQNQRENVMLKKELLEIVIRRKYWQGVVTEHREEIDSKPKVMELKYQLDLERRKKKKIIEKLKRDRKKSERFRFKINQLKWQQKNKKKD